MGLVSLRLMHCIPECSQLNWRAPQRTSSNWITVVEIKSQTALNRCGRRSRGDRTLGTATQALVEDRRLFYFIFIAYQ